LEEINTMTVPTSIDPALPWIEQIDRAEPDLLRAMLKTFVQALVGAEADAICGAPFASRSDVRVNTRNGYRPREWDTRAGTIELAIPKLRSGFVSLVIAGLTESGVLEPGRLYESPFTDVAAQGPDDMFASADVESLLDILVEVRVHAIPAAEMGSAS
jgi:type I site-specific restriction endonuclease